MRSLSIAFNAALLLLTFALGRTLGGVLIGFTAAAFAATSSQLFHDSLYARPESFFSMLTMVAALLSVMAARRASVGYLVSAYFVVGLMLACKITAAFVLPFPALVFLLGAHVQPNAAARPRSGCEWRRVARWRILRRAVRVRAP